MTATAGTASPDGLLELSEVQVRYGGRDFVFDPLSLRVAHGEIVALRGRSGSGKSSALSVAMGLHKPSRGTVTFAGRDIYAMDEAGRAELRRDHYGVVLQDGGLLHGLSALENVLVPVLRHRATKADRTRAMDALGMVGLSDRAEHSPDRLSGGEAQRVAIARALFADPQLLLIDEPTASLDRRAADSVISLIREVAASRRGVLVASHDPAVVDLAVRVHDIERDLSSSVS